MVELTYKQRQSGSESMLLIAIGLCSRHQLFVELKEIHFPVAETI